jgi:hypothetical protein
MLHNEGDVMGHCVGGGGYTNKCRSGESRIFSIRKNGESKATVEIGAGQAGDWRIRQIRGRKNANVSDRLSTIGNQVLTEWARKREKGEEEFFPNWANEPQYIGDLNDTVVAAPGR